MLSVVFVIAALAVSGTTAATAVTVTCLAAGPKATIEITGATAGYTVYSVDTQCASALVPVTGPLTYEMDAGDATDCTFTLSTTFLLVIQQYSGLVSSGDEVWAVKCSANEVKSVPLTTTLLALTSSVSPVFGIAVTFEVTDANNAPLTSATVGQDVKLRASIPQTNNAATGFSISKVTFRVGIEVAVTIINDGCPVSGSPMSAPGKKDIGLDGVLMVPFKMFVPAIAGTRPAPSSTVTIEVTVTLCIGNCPAVTCASGRKRRSADEHVVTDVMTLTRPLIILPPGMSVVTRNETINNNGRTEAQEIPIFSTALIATVVALGVVLALCILVLVFMFCRLRRHMDASDSKKSALENKAYN